MDTLVKQETGDEMLMERCGPKKTHNENGKTMVDFVKSVLMEDVNSLLRKKRKKIEKKIALKFGVMFELRKMFTD